MRTGVPGMCPCGEDCRGIDYCSPIQHHVVILEEAMRILLCLLLLAAPVAAQVAPDATLLSGGPITVSEYKLPVAIDPVVSASLATELWARVYRPGSLGSSRHSLLVLLHGNHATCGRV